MPGVARDWQRHRLAYSPTQHSTFHRLIRGFMVQGGDITAGDGTGGCSIYGPSFPDENFLRPHTARGQLSMANAGPDTNGSQFFITFGATPHLNGKHVMFGQLVSGGDVLDLMEAVAVGDQDKPRRDVTITDCGQVTLSPEAARAAAEAAAAAAPAPDAARGGPAAQVSLHAAGEELGLPLAFSGRGRKRRGDTAQADAGAAVEHHLAQHIRAVVQAPALPSSEAGEAGEAGEGGDGSEGGEGGGGGGELTPAEQRLLKLRMRMNAGRRANRSSVVEEGKRQADGRHEGRVASAAPPSMGGGPTHSAKRRRKGPDVEGPAMLGESAAEVASRLDRRQRAKTAQEQSYSWFQYNSEARHREYSKALGHLQGQPEARVPDAAAAASAVAGQGGALSYGQEDFADAGRVEALSARLTRKAKRRAPKLPKAGDTVDYINEKNRAFNARAEKYFGKFSAGTKQNLERGTAL